jgi:Prolyl oligopeptidase family
VSRAHKWSWTVGGDRRVLFDRHIAEAGYIVLSFDNRGTPAFRYPEIYKVGMSVASVSDPHYYDTIYQERYMGTSQDNPSGYARGSPINYADGLSGDLLIVSGSGDDNCNFLDDSDPVESSHQSAQDIRLHGIPEPQPYH